MKAAVEIAVIKPSRSAETPISVYVAIGSFTIGTVLIVTAVLRWLLTSLGSNFRESSSLMILLIGYALFAIGGHCLDLFESHDRASR